MRASINLAATEVAPLAEYTPSANSDNPPAAARVLSQSVTRAFSPVPTTLPAVLLIKHDMKLKSSENHNDISILIKIIIK